MSGDSVSVVSRRAMPWLEPRIYHVYWALEEKILWYANDKVIIVGAYHSFAPLWMREGEGRVEKSRDNKMRWNACNKVTRSH